MPSPCLGANSLWWVDSQWCFVETWVRVILRHPKGQHVPRTGNHSRSHCRGLGLHRNQGTPGRNRGAMSFFWKIDKRQMILNRIPCKNKNILYINKSQTSYGYFLALYFSEISFASEKHLSLIPSEAYFGVHTHWFFTVPDGRVVTQE